MDLGYDTKPAGNKDTRCLAIIDWDDKMSDIFTKINQPLKKSHGVALLNIPGHQMYIRFDTRKNLYRIGDPNIGILTFDNKDNFFACLKSLLDTFYFYEKNPDENIHLGIHQLVL